MEQVLIGGKYNLLHATNIEYGSVYGARVWDSGLFAALVISTPGKLKSLRVELNDTPGGGSKTYTFTLRRAVGTAAYSNTALTCTVGSGDTQANDMVNEVAVAAGDVVVLECDPTDTPTARYAKWTMVFEGDNANESLLMASSESHTTGDKFSRVMGLTGNIGIENDARSVCPTSGTIKNLFVYLNVDPGSAPDAYKYTLRIDGVDKALTVTIVANNRTGNNTVDDIAVSVGDILTVSIERVDTPTVECRAAIGMTFVADIDGESLILGATASDLDNTATEFNHLIPAEDAWNATEAERYQLAQVCVLKKLHMLLSGTPGASKKYTFTVRRNDASPASGLVVEIAGAATTGNDTGNTVTIANDDEINLMVVPDATPTVRDAYWGLVSYIDPSPPAVVVPGGSPLAQMIQAGLV